MNLAINLSSVESFETKVERVVAALVERERHTNSRLARFWLECFAKTFIIDHVVDALEDVLDELRGVNWYECKNEGNWKFEHQRGEGIVKCRLGYSTFEMPEDIYFKAIWDGFWGSSSSITVKHVISDEERAVVQADLEACNTVESPDCYDIADHEKRTLFWLAHYAMQPLRYLNPVTYQAYQQGDWHSEHMQSDEFDGIFICCGQARMFVDQYQIEAAREKVSSSAIAA